MKNNTHQRLAELEAKLPEAPMIRQFWDAYNEVNGSEARKHRDEPGHAYECDPAIPEIEEISVRLAVLEYDRVERGLVGDDATEESELKQRADALLIDLFERHGKKDVVEWLSSDGPAT